MSTATNLSSELNQLRLKDLRSIATKLKLKGRGTPKNKSQLIKFLQDAVQKKTITRKQLRDEIARYPQKGTPSRRKRTPSPRTRKTTPSRRARKSTPTRRRKGKEPAPAEPESLREMLMARTLEDLTKVAADFGISRCVKKQRLVDRLVKEVEDQAALQRAIGQYEISKRFAPKKSSPRPSTAITIFGEQQARETIKDLQEQLETIGKSLRESKSTIQRESARNLRAQAFNEDLDSIRRRIDQLPILTESVAEGSITPAEVTRISQNLETLKGDAETLIAKGLRLFKSGESTPEIDRVTGELMELALDLQNTQQELDIKPTTDVSSQVFKNLLGVEPTTLVGVDSQVLQERIEEFLSRIPLSGLEKVMEIPILYRRSIDLLPIEDVTFQAQKLLGDLEIEIGSCREKIGQLRLDLSQKVADQDGDSVLADADGNLYYLAQTRVESYREAKDNLRSLLNIVTETTEGLELPARLEEAMKDVVSFITNDILSQAENAYLQALLAEDFFTTSL
jgi:hypothetical protein